MVSSNGAICVFWVNAHITQVYSLTQARVHPWCNRVDGGGVGFGVNFKQLQEAKVNVLIMCSSSKIS